MSEKKKAVVLLSGGLDSATALAIAKSEGFEIHAISFRYGQRHQVEIESARRVVEAMGVSEHLILDIDLRSIGGSALTADIEVPKERSSEEMDEEIPVTYVPARNTIFLSFALAWAEVIEAQDIFIGVNFLDYCVPGDTDVITKHGLKKIRDICLQDYVMSYGQDGISWKQVIFHARSPRQEKLLRIRCGGSIFDCTPNHHMLRVDYDKKHRLLLNKRVVHVQAQDLRVGDYLLLPAQEIDIEQDISEEFDFTPYIDLVQWKSESLEIKDGKIGRVTGSRNLLPLYCKLADVLRVIAWYVTEGWITNSNGVCISQKKEENICAIVRAIESIGLKAHIESRVYGEKVIFFSHPVISTWLKTLGKKARDKHLPDWCLALPNKYLSILFEALIKGDGCWQRQSKLKGKPYDHFYCDFYSTSELLLKQTIYIAARLGYRASIPNSSKSGVISAHFSKPRSRLVNGASIARISAIERVENTGDLYDITVEKNHSFVGGMLGFIIAGQSGYPDCRPEYIEAFERMANLATKAGVEGRLHLKIHTPLIRMTKAEIITEGLRLGVDYSLTHSCYDPADGLACGRCDSCQLRLKGFREAGAIDPLRYAR